VASQQMTLFYNARTRGGAGGATARIDDAGVLQPLHEIPADDLEPWTHLARFILFYNADSRTGAAARIDGAGVLGAQQPLTADFGPWTHLVA